MSVCRPEWGSKGHLRLLASSKVPAGSSAGLEACKTSVSPEVELTWMQMAWGSHAWTSRAA